MKTKLCVTCGSSVGPLPLSQFYKHKEMSDGHLNKCKSCFKAKVRAYAAANPEKIRKLTREKKRRSKYKILAKRWVRRNITRSREIKNNWASRNREKRKAHGVVRNAIRGGRLRRPKRCDSCQKVRKVHAHHDDYSKPLEVKWLCAECHGITRHKDRI